MKKENLKKNVSRRTVLKGSIATAGTLLGSSFLGKALANGLTLTPPQTEGPFYPEDTSGNNDNDLLRKHSATDRAAGEVVSIEGRVVDQFGEAVPLATVDVWQANRHGRYHHSRDNQNPAPIDPNLQIRGLMLTDSQGRFNFRTIIPGHYPATPGWTRPAHIHYMVKRLGYRELTTQMYFKGTPFLEEDRILRDLTEAERNNVIIDFKTTQMPDGSTMKIGVFTVVIKKLV